MKKLVLSVAALVLASAAVPAAFAGEWWDGKYEANHKWSYDEWRNHRSSWEAEHKAEKHWDEKQIRHEWEVQKLRNHW